MAAPSVAAGMYNEGLPDTACNTFAKCLILQLQAVRALRARCHAFLLQQLPPEMAGAAAAAAGDMTALQAQAPPGRWGLGAFTIERGPQQPAGGSNEISATLQQARMSVRAQFREDTLRFCIRFQPCACFSTACA